MLRRSFHAVAALSLVLMFALAAVWLRSYWACDEWAYRFPPTARWDVRANATSNRGVMVLAAMVEDPAMETGSYRRGFEHFAAPALPLDEGQGAAFMEGGVAQWPHLKWWLDRYDKDLAVAAPGQPVRLTDAFISFPIWAAFALSSVPPGLWLRWWGRERRKRIGCCRRCGYDLRGNPAAAACPECGVPVGR